jgi:predicted PurR-regulated permease PerM
MPKLTLPGATRVLFFAFLLLAALYFAKGFLIPLLLAGILAMLFTPLSYRMEEKKFPRLLAAFICVLVFLAAIAVVVALVSWQVSDFAKDAAQMKQEVKIVMTQVEKFVNETFGIPVKEQEDSLMALPDNIGNMAITSAATLFSLLIDFVLLVVYMLLLLYFRSHLRQFVLKAIPPAERENAGKIMSESGEVAQQYLSGLAKMVVTLWVMYGIAFSLIGVKSAIFFAVLCGLLEIVPFLGSLTGCTLTALMVLAQGGGGGMLAGVFISYGSIQLVQSYVLEPLVVGSTVNLNALFTIIALVAGEMVWGVPGMILAIPLTGIFKIVCDHIEILKPYGFLLGDPPRSKPVFAFIEKWKEKWWGKK